MRNAGFVQSTKESNNAWSCRVALSGVHRQSINMAQDSRDMGTGARIATAMV